MGQTTADIRRDDTTLSHVRRHKRWMISNPTNEMSEDYLQYLSPPHCQSNCPLWANLAGNVGKLLWGMTQGSLAEVGTNIHDWHLAVNHCPGALQCRRKMTGFLSRLLYFGCTVYFKDKYVPSWYHLRNKFFPCFTAFLMCELCKCLEENVISLPLCIKSYMQVCVVVDFSYPLKVYGGFLVNYCAGLQEGKKRKACNILTDLTCESL